MEQTTLMLNERAAEGSRVTLRVMAGNLLLSAIYLLTGFLGNSIAATSEGIDSLTDSISSLLLLLGFKISARKPDRKHPYGHHRIEYIVGLFISEILLFAAVSLVKTSIGLMFRPAAPVSTLLLLVSIVGAAGKLLIACYLKQKNKRLCSASLTAYYRNTLADLKGICFVAVSALLQHFTTLPVDAVAGLVLAVLIGLDGLKSFGENVSLLIGEGNSYANE